MFETLEQIEINGKMYPIRCDINVMIEIQEQFESLNAFELAIVGLEVSRKEDGTVERDDKGDILFYRKEPSIKAIRCILPLMIHEGIEAFMQDGTIIDASSVDEDVKSMRFDFKQVAESMSREFQKCFHRKNSSSAKKSKEKATNV